MPQKDIRLTYQQCEAQEAEKPADQLIEYLKDSVLAKDHHLLLDPLPAKLIYFSPGKGECTTV